MPKVDPELSEATQRCPEPPRDTKSCKELTELSKKIPKEMDKTNKKLPRDDQKVSKDAQSYQELPKS